MVNILSIAEKVSSIFENLSIDESKCAKLKSNLSSCNRCINTCPVDAITLTETLGISDSCINCGLCATKCPTGALDWKDSTGQSLLEKIIRVSKKQEKIYIQCSKQPLNSSVLNLQVPCLGMFTTELWMIMLKVQTDFVLVHQEENCKNCSCSGFGDYFTNELNIAENLLKIKLPLHQQAFLDEKSMEQSSVVDYSKRQWFGGIFGFLRNTPKKAIHSWTEDVIEHSEKKKLEQNYLMSPRRKAASYLIKSFPEIEQKLTINIPSFNENCEYCKACSLLCPNQAITQIEEKEKTHIRVDHLLCSECHLCHDICYFDACHLQKFVELKDRAY